VKEEEPIYCIVDSNKISVCYTVEKNKELDNAKFDFEWISVSNIVDFFINNRTLDKNYDYNKQFCSISNILNINNKQEVYIDILSWIWYTIKKGRQINQLEEKKIDKLIFEEWIFEGTGSAIKTCIKDKDLYNKVYCNWLNVMRDSNINILSTDRDNSIITKCIFTILWI